MSTNANCVGGEKEQLPSVANDPFDELMRRCETQPLLNKLADRLVRISVAFSVSMIATATARISEGLPSSARNYDVTVPSQSYFGYISFNPSQSFLDKFEFTVRQLHFAPSLIYLASRSYCIMESGS
jgi:hypothetical protein